MSSASNRDPFAGMPKELHVLEWPLRQQPWRTLLVLGGMLAAAAYAARSLTQPWLALVALLLLLASVWRLWLPVRFELGPRGVTERILGRTRRIAWREIARCEFRRRGVLLVADADHSALSSLRGLYIHFPRDPQRLREVLDFYLSTRPRAARKEDSASGSRTASTDRLARDES